MKLSLGVLCAVACIACAGCHKKSSPQAGSPPGSTLTNAAEGEGAVAPPEPPQPPSREVLARADDKARQAVVGEVDAFLTGELHTFVQQKNRMPASFSELARSRLDSVPRPPAGKKWVIDADNIEVKLVTSQ